MEAPPCCVRVCVKKKKKRSNTKKKSKSKYTLCHPVFVRIFCTFPKISFFPFVFFFRSPRLKPHLPLLLKCLDRRRERTTRWQPRLLPLLLLLLLLRQPLLKLNLLVLALNHFPSSRYELKTTNQTFLMLLFFREMASQLETSLN